LSLSSAKTVKNAHNSAKTTKIFFILNLQNKKNVKIIEKFL